MPEQPKRQRKAAAESKLFDGKVVERRRTAEGGDYLRVVLGTGVCVCGGGWVGVEGGRGLGMREACMRSEHARILLCLWLMSSLPAC